MKRLIPLTLLLSLWGCGGSSPDVAGGAEDVNTFVLTGVCVNNSGYLIPDATVQLIPSDYIEGESDETDIITTTANSVGEFTLKANKEENYTIAMMSKDSVDQFIQFNIETDSSIISRIDTLKPLGLMQFSLPDKYSQEADIVVPGTAIRYPVSNLEIVEENGILSTVIPLPENDYREILYSEDEVRTNVTEDEIFQVQSEDTTNGKIREVWGLLMYSQIPGTVTSLEAVDAHSFWVGTQSEGLFYVTDDANERWSAVPYKNIDADVTLSGISALDASGDSLLIACDDGVVLLVNGEFQNLSKNNATVENFTVNDVTILDDGWIAAAFSTGVGRYKDGTWKHSATVNNAPLGEVVTIDGWNRERLFAADAYGIISIDTEGSCSYVNNEGYIFRDIVITDKSVHLASDDGVLSLVDGVLVRASKSNGIDIRAIAGTDSVMWASSTLEEDLFALRKHSSHYYYNNSPLEADDIIGGIGYSDGVAFFATESGKLLNMQYKTID